MSNANNLQKKYLNGHRNKCKSFYQSAYGLDIVVHRGESKAAGNRKINANF